MKKFHHRVILISDIHYTCQEKSSDPQVHTSAAAGDAFGYTQKEKVALALQDVQKEADTLDAVFVLGDLSLDDAHYRNLPENYCQKFREEFMEQLPCPCYALPGNHDSYPDTDWMQLFGYGRQFSVKIADAAFIALDTFARVPATNASGAAFTDVDMTFLKQELEKYPQEKIFLLSHYFLPERNGALAQLVNNDPRIVCLFQGHTHINRVLRPSCLQETGGYRWLRLSRGMCGRKMDLFPIRSLLGLGIPGFAVGCGNGANIPHKASKNLSGQQRHILLSGSNRRRTGTVLSREIILSFPVNSGGADAAITPCPVRYASNRNLLL